MRLRIVHNTSYSYSEPVFALAHHLYFYPALRPGTDLFSFQLEVDPVPSGLSARLDAENNAYHQCWFNDPIDHLNIRVELDIEIAPFNPFDFLVEKTPKTEHQEAVQVYLTPRIALSTALMEWATDLKRQSGENLITLLSMLCREISLNWEHEARYQENLLDPEECFAARKGSCRDLSWLMIQTLRSLDIPARFVSGYAYNPELGSGHELHAWVEVWMTGAGWIGLDPSSGLFITENYIPIVTSYHPANTLPVQGSYRGKATSLLETSVKVEPISG